MNIKSANVYRIEIPMHTSYRAAVHDFSTMDAFIIELISNCGTRGIGTVDPSPGYSRQTPPEIQNSLSEIVPTMIEQTPENPNKLLQYFNTIDGHENAKCGVEMAYLDLYCRKREINIQEFLGGAFRQSESLNGWVGIETPTNMAKKAEEYSKKGFKSVKLKLNGDSEQDIERIRTTCRAVGDEIQIRADVNGAYDVETAIHVAQSLEDTSLEHLEQPVPLTDIEGLKQVTEATKTTIMADECLLSLSDVWEVLSRNAADRIKVKTLRLGGILPTRRALDTAESAGVPCIVGHGFGLSPAMSAELQLTTSHENVVTPIESVGALKMQEEPFKSVISVDNGSATIPDGYGLGIQLDNSQLPKFTTASDTYQ